MEFHKQCWADNDYSNVECWSSLSSVGRNFAIVMLNVGIPQAIGANFYYSNVKYWNSSSHVSHISTIGMINIGIPQAIAPEVSAPVFDFSFQFQNSTFEFINRKIDIIKGSH